MKKQELLKYFDDDLLDKLFGFCYARTNDSYEAQELCSDIIFALVKAAQTDGEITNLYSFIWRVARNVYADFSKNRKKQSEYFYSGNADDILQFTADKGQENDCDELLDSVYRRIAFLSKAYREVMIMFYIDGMSAAEIAGELNIGEGTVRQRLFSARQKVKSEVKEMKETYNRPVSLEEVNYVILGTGNPGWGDPRSVCTRKLSKQIVWLCRKKNRSASEIAEELNVPTVYIEEELEILANGENGEYGLLRRMGNGRYGLNFILLDKCEIEKMWALYTAQLPKICSIISDYIEKHREEYLSFPYLNRKIDFNLILWQQIFTISQIFSENVEQILNEKYFSQTEAVNRPFSVFGYIDNGRYYGGGWDGVNAENVCGFSKIHLDNIYITRIEKHFSCGLNVSKEVDVQLALRAIDGLSVDTLSEAEKEYAAKSVECGYLYSEDGKLYTKILVNDMKDRDRLFEISRGLAKGFFEEQAQAVAEKLAALIKKTIPDYLCGEWRLANRLANMPVLDSVVENLIEKGILVPPENGIGAEGCWASVEK